MGDGRAQVSLIVTQGVQRVFQFGGRGVLEQVPMGARFQGLHDQGRVGVHRQDQHFGLRADPLELLQGFEAACLLHGNIQQHDIRRQVLDHVEQLRAIIGLANNRVARKIQHQGAYACPDQRVVIHQK
ncbi:hypothetical protein D3C76_1151930 [compost metagenome]